MPRLLAPIWLLLATAVFAQSPPPAYQELRYEEDWSSLSNGKRSDFWDPVKYIGLGRAGWFTSIGGEARLRYEFFRNAAFGAAPETPYGFLIQRYLLHADTHFGPHFRIFTQAQSGLESWRVGGPRATDKDILEIHQAFIDINTSENRKKTVTLRVGRQEFEFGSGHYLSASEVFNVRRSFDGVRLIAPLGKWTFNAIAAKPVELNPEIFDDSPDHTQTVWAAGVFGPHPIIPKGNMSVYVIGFDHKVARFDQGAGRETRRTLGVRNWGRARGLDYNYEFLFQWGGFAGSDIRAWAMASETGYTLPKARFAPRFGMRANASSGDQDRTNRTLNTFNPLFPTTAYSGRIGLIGASNVMDLTPTFRLRLHKRVYFLPESSFFLRESKGDGIYTVTGLPYRTGRLTPERFIGTQASLPMQVSIDRHLTWTVALSRFYAGPYLKASPPGRSVTYLTSFMTYKF